MKVLMSVMMLVAAGQLALGQLLAGQGQYTTGAAAYEAIFAREVGGHFYSPDMVSFRVTPVSYTDQEIANLNQYIKLHAAEMELLANLDNIVAIR